MSTISSSLKLVDRFSSVIDKYINGINKVSDNMEEVSSAASLSSSKANTLSRSLDKIDGSGAAAAAQKIDSLTEKLNLAENEISGLTSGLHSAESEITSLNSKLNKFGNNNTPLKMASGFGGLSKAIIVANQGLQLTQQLYNGISRVMGGADERNSSDARLSLIKDNSHTQDQLEAQIMRTANASRAKYEPTADLVAKVGRQDMFKRDNDKAVRFADIINKSFVVSGTSTSEAEGAITQLNQGLASGVLRGDEFNSVMENASVLQEQIAANLGVNKGKLRELATEGKLTADVIANAILKSGDSIDNMFTQMPMTFGQGIVIIQNHISQLVNDLSKPGKALNNIIVKVQELIIWLDSADGQKFFEGLSQGVNILVNALIWAFDLFGDIYNFVSTNWNVIAPILAGIATAVVLLTIALKIATVVQWAMNAALFACPATWIILAIIAVIAIIVGLTIWIIKLWQTNLDFKVGVISIWNSILGFFDKIPLFFMLVGYGIANAFSDAKVSVLLTLQNMANGAIDIINELINRLNTIPGVSIDTIQQVTFGAEAMIEETAKKQQRIDDYNAASQMVDDKAAARAAELAENKTKWQAEIDEKRNAAEKAKSTDANPDKPVNAYVSGGGLDKDVNISETSLQYLNDIAERNALQQFDTLNAQMQLVYDDADAKLSNEDKDLMMSVAGRGTSVYYLQYDGGVNMKNNIKQGDDWETIKQQIRAETQSEIEIGLSGMDEVVLQ